MADFPPAPRRSPAADRPSDGARRPRRERLTTERILDAAVIVLDRDGLNGVTMRAVADELDTGGASLYAHFPSKDALIDGVLDRVYSEIELPERIDGRRWKAQLKDIVRSIRATLNAHRDIARAGLGNIPTSPYALQISEKLIETMKAGGLADQTIAYGVDLLALYATAVAFEESMYTGDGHAPEAIAAWQEEMADYFRSLPADRFPLVVALAGPLTAGTPDGDERFTFGLDVIVAGLDAQPRPRRTGPPPPTSRG